MFISPGRIIRDWSCRFRAPVGGAVRSRLAIPVFQSCADGLNGHDRRAGVDARSEEASSHGRAGMVVRTGGQVFILEFRMADTDADIETRLEAAFTQMRRRGYAERYRDRQDPVHLVAVVCGREARNLLEVRAGSAIIT